ncbi:DUF4382 domain-containing protein, partial [Candidatus Parcubacteria bacterium]
MWKPGLRAVGLCLLVILPLACSGGGSGSAPGQQARMAEVPTTLSVTDRRIDTFAQAFVSLKKVTLESDGTRRVLFEDAAGVPINLLELSGEKRPLSVAALPPGTYTVTVTLDNSVTLVEDDGTVHTGHFGNAATLTVPVTGQITVNDSSREVVLDFNARSFDFDDTSGKVTPQIQLVSAGAGLPFHNKFTGRVVDVQDDQTFTFRLEHGTTVITVTLLPGAVVFDEASGQTGSTTALLAPDQN